MNKEILRLAIPNIISNISIPLLSSVDTMLMGHLSPAELGAVGIAGMIFNFVYWNFGFLRMGTTGMAAQEYGRNNSNEISAILQKSLIVSLGISLLILLLMSPIVNLSSLLMNVPENQVSYVKEYFYIRIWAAPATLSLYAFLGWFFGLQNAKIPLIITIGINLLNIILSYFFVKVVDMGITGVALGTLISQYFGAILCVIFIIAKFKKYLIKTPYKILLAWENMKRFFQINSDIFLRTICLSFAFAFLYSQAALKGEIYLAANVVLLQFLNWMSYGIDGFAFAAESLVGKYYGAGDKKGTFRVIKLIFFWGAGLAIFYSLSYLFGGVAILHIFTNIDEVIILSRQLLYWVIFLPIISFACYIWDGIYIGLTASKAMRNTMILSLLIYVGTYYFVYMVSGKYLIWFSLMLFLASRGVFQTIVFNRKGLEIR